MSLKALSWCAEQNDLPPGEFVVLFHLCHCHNAETGRCDPSQEYLAERSNMGVRTVRRHLSSLEQMGKIQRQKRGIEGGGRLSDFVTLSFEPANLAGGVTGQSVRTNRPNGAKNVHEMAGKQGKNRERTRNARESGLFGDGDLPDQTSADEHFIRFWKVYPKKAGKPAAEKAFIKAIDTTPAETIIEGAERYAKWLVSGKDSGDFRPHAKHPQGWIKDRRWEDPDIWVAGDPKPETYAQQVLRQYGGGGSVQ